MNILTGVILLSLLLGASDRSWGGDFGWSGNDLHGVPCHGPSGGYGPFDYTDPQIRKRLPGSPLYLVEEAHYTKHVQLLMEGGDPANHSSNEGNLDYTLRAFPNHHKALWTMMQWYLRTGREKASQTEVPPPECWLQRAISFSPDDSVVYMLYGIYLQLSGLPDRSAEYYKKSLVLDPNSGEAHYNYGLVLADLHRYKDAVEQARKAYHLGYQLPGLAMRLRRAGYAMDEATLVTDPK